MKPTLTVASVLDMKRHSQQQAYDNVCDDAPSQCVAPPATTQVLPRCLIPLHKFLKFFNGLIPHLSSVVQVRDVVRVQILHDGEV